MTHSNQMITKDGYSFLLENTYSEQGSNEGRLTVWNVKEMNVWFTRWSQMGSSKILQFLQNTDKHYFARKLCKNIKMFDQQATIVAIIDFFENNSLSKWSDPGNDKHDVRIEFIQILDELDLTTNSNVFVYRINEQLKHSSYLHEYDLEELLDSNVFEKQLIKYKNTSEYEQLLVAHSIIKSF